MVKALSTKRESRGFDWLATVFYPLSVVLMEVFWLYPWLSWLGNWPMFVVKRPILSLASVVITLAGSLILTRLVTRQKWALWQIRTVIIGGGLVVILLVLAVDYRDGYVFLSGAWFAHIGQVLGVAVKSTRTFVIALPVLVYLWWRGIALGQTTSYFHDIYRSFILGLAAMILLIIVWQLSAGSTHIARPGSDVGIYVMAFFFFGLISIAVSHLYVMRGSMPKEEARLTSVWRWVPTMLGVIGGMILVGFGVASIFSPDIFASIGRGLGTFGHFLGKVLEYLLVPLNYIFEGIYRVLVWLINLLRNNQMPSDNQSANMTGQMFPEVTTKGLPPVVTDVIKWTVITLLAALVVFILAKAVSRLRARRAQEEIEELHDSIFSWKGLRDDLKELLGMMGNRFKRKPGETHISFNENASGRLDMREIYRHLQWEGARSEIPRRRHETAVEYAARLRQALPEVNEPVNDITGAYEKVRYGEQAASEQQLDRANSLWGRLRGLLRKFRET
jgi:hypothetical protein